MTYLVKGLDPTPFKALFDLPDDELPRLGTVRMTVDQKPGYPCRITLQDREVGETVLLVNHVSHDVANPYHASHAIFVWESATEPAQFVDEVPPVFMHRPLSLRGFDQSGMMVDALLADCGEAEAGIRRLFANPRIETIHAHNAARGCFSATIDRS